MAPAEPQRAIQRVDALLQSLPGDDPRLEKVVESLQSISRVLAAVACLVDCYGPVFSYGGVFDSFLERCEALGEKKHTWKPLVRRRSSHGEEAGDMAVLSREIAVFIVQFALRSNAPFLDGMPPSSLLGGLFRQLHDLNVRVGALKRAQVRGELRIEALKTHAAELRETWEGFCGETGIAKEERLCATGVLAPWPSRFLADHRWHATPCLHRSVLGTRPTWGWPTRTRSTPGKTMATITLSDRRYLLQTYRRSTSLPKTIKWAGTTEPKWVAGAEEQPGQPIVLEHKLSVPEREPDLVPYTPHRMHDQDLVVRFSGTQEVVVKDRYDRITFHGMTQPEYSFLDVKYLTQFHQDLRGRKQVTRFDVDNISSAASAAHSTKLYVWRDTQDPDIHFHTLSYHSQAEGRELEFPLLWLHETCIKQRPSSKSLLLHFRLDAEHDGDKGAIKRHSGVPLLSSPRNTLETKDVGHLYVPLRYRAFVGRYKYLVVNFDCVTGCDSFKKAFEEAHYKDSLVHLLHCLPLPNPMLGLGPQPSSASWRSATSSATATSSGSSTFDYLGLSPNWSEALRPITEPPDTDPELPTAVAETMPELTPQNSRSYPDGHPGLMI